MSLKIRISLAGLPLTPFDPRVQTFRVNVELSTDCHGHTRKTLFEPKGDFRTKGDFRKTKFRCLVRGGVLEMTQKDIEGDVFTWTPYTWDFEMAQLHIGSKSRSRVKTPRGLTFSDLKLWDSSKFEQEPQFEILIASNFEPSQSFRSEKVSPLGVLTRDRDFEPMWSWAISKSHSMSFWAISRIPA